VETVKLLVRDALHQAPNISAPTGPVNPADSCIFVTVLYFPVFFVSCIFLYFYFLLLCCVYSFRLLMAQTILLSHFQSSVVMLTFYVEL